MLKIYGCSDDLVEIEGAKYPDDEIGCFNSKVKIWFTDGTVIEVGYCKPGMGVWFINILEKGTAEQTLTICEDEDAEVYSDIFEIDAEIVKHEVV